MKTLFMLLGLIFFSVSFAQVPPCNCNITVFGDIHLTVSDKSRDAEVKKTQNWLYEAVQEKIVVIEGITMFGPLTKDSLVYGLMKEYKNKTNVFIDPKVVLATFKEQSAYDVKVRFILEGKKIVFGGEDNKVHQKIKSIDPGLAMEPEILNLRSKIILTKAFKVCKKYPKSNIAIIIGRRHLEWFRDNGFAVVDVPGYK